jgi:cytochrome P450
VEFDPRTPEFLADPYPALAELRETTPVLHHEELERWFVTRHADVRACLRDRRLGRNFRHVGTEDEFKSETLDPRWAAFWEVERWSLLWLEPPDHTRIRKLVAAAFTPRSVEAMRAPAADLAGRLLDPLVERGRFDLLYDFAQPYSIGLICDWLGVPVDNHRDLLDWSHAMVKMYELDTSGEQAVTANAAAAAFRDYVLELIAERRRAPREDLVSGLVHAQVDGEHLSDAEIVSTVIVLLNAGHEATVNVTGNGWWALFRNPSALAALGADASLLPTAVEELMRYDTPLQMFERWVLEDISVRGVDIPRGSEVALLFGSANRDPEVFASPDDLDVGRRDNPHISFGAGIHYCLGAPLARIELVSSFGALLRAAPGLSLVEEPTWKPGYIIRGLSGLVCVP